MPIRTLGAFTSSLVAFVFAKRSFKPMTCLHAKDRGTGVSPVSGNGPVVQERRSFANRACEHTAETAMPPSSGLCDLGNFRENSNGFRFEMRLGERELFRSGRNLQSVLEDHRKMASGQS